MKMTGLSFQVTCNIASFNESNKRTDSRTDADRNRNDNTEVQGFEFGIGYQIESMEVDPKEIQAMFDCVTGALKSAFDAKVEETKAEAAKTQAAE